MKHKLLGVLFILFVLTSCKDDDNDSPSGNENPNPTSGTVSATINGDDFSGEDNVSRYLSYGDFIIKSSSDQEYLTFQLDNFIGNANYSLSSGLGNSAEYYTVVNNETVGFESISGELVVTDYNETTKTFNASFNITFARIGDPSITVAGEGNYSALSILEITEPSSGEVTAFYLESEYYDFEDSVLVYENGAIILNFADTEDGSPSFTFTSSNAANPDVFSSILLGENTTLSGNEIISYTYDEENNLVSGRFKNTGTDTDLEIWFTDIPVDSAETPISSEPTLNLNGEIIEFDIVNLSVEELSPDAVIYQMTAFKNDEQTYFAFIMINSSVSPGLDQTINGSVIYENELNPETNLPIISATMILEPGFVEGTANIEVNNFDAPGINGVFTAFNVEVVE
jgi:hypothetical protein